MRAVIYARRSQKTQDASVRTQIEEATRFIEAKAWTHVETYPDDQKHTGRKEFVKRREFLRLLADAEESKFDIVVVRDHTRLGGDTSRTMRAVEDLIDAGVEVWYYIENRRVTLATAMDKIMFAVQSGTAEAERDGISSRVFEALNVRARKKKNVGGRCYGYSNVPIVEGEKRVSTDYAINEEQAKIVREIFTMYAAGKGLRAIAIDLNSRGIPSPSAGKRGIGLWSSSALFSMLRRERYRGTVVYGKHKKTYRKGTKVRVKRDPSELTVADAPEQRIVPEELWTAVQGQIASSAHKPWVCAPGPKSKHLLAGLAFCGVCGGRMKVHRAKFGADNVKLYVCKRQQELAACENKLKRPLEEIDAEVIEEIQRRVLSTEFVAAVLREARTRLTERMKAAESDEAPRLKAEAVKVKGELANLAEAVACGGAAIPALVAKMTERQAWLTAIEGRLAALHAAPRALQLETKRLEKEIGAALGELREVFTERPQDARRFLEKLLDGNLTFTPVDTWKGRRYRIEGLANLGGLIRLPQTLIVASPGGFEPPLAT